MDRGNLCYWGILAALAACGGAQPAGNPSQPRVDAGTDANTANHSDGGTSLRDSGSGTSDRDGGVAANSEEQLSPTPVYAATGIHVSTTGSDGSGDGSAGAPYRTIQHALDEAGTEGSTILIHGGTYNEEVRIRASNLTLQSVQGERAHIHCPVSTNADDPPLCIEIDAETTGVTLRGLEVSGGFYSVFLGSQWDWDDSPLDNLAANHVLIEDCVLHDSGRDVVKVPAGCNDITIRRSEIYNSGMGYAPGTPTDEKNAEGIDVVNSARFHLADSHIHDTATTCVYVKGGSVDTLIERVRAENCGALGISLGFDTSPEFFDTAGNPEYFENIRGTVRNSIVNGTGLAGIALYASSDARILHNTIRNAGEDGHAAIYFGVATQDYDPDAGRPANQNPTVIGNLIDQSEMDDPQCFGIRYSEDDELGVLNALAGSAVIRNNLYFAGGSQCGFSDGRPGSELDAGSFSAWQAHVTGFDQGSLNADPLLDDTDHLREGSPAIDATDATSGVGYDIDGDLRSAQFDLGADER